MNWSTTIARVSGIDIKLHITFPLILLLGALQWGSAHGPTGAAFGALLMALLFLCVTLHELGHSLVAQSFRIPVREIVLLPLGGVALLGRMPEKPRQELLIAAAGPAVNVVLAAMIYLVTGATLGWEGLDGKGLVAGTRAEPSLGTLLVWLMEANISLVLFNLIPAFPLDGGRMLRAGLAMVTDYQRATRIAAGTGQLLAISLGVLGVVGGNFLLVLVAVFVFFGAGMESAQTAVRTVLTSLRVGDAYNKHALTLTPADRVSKVVDYLLTSYQPDFGVVHGGRLLGVVTRNDVLRALAAPEEDPYVTGIMRREVERVDARAGLDEVQQVMSERSTRLVAVHEGERFLGLVSAEDIAEALAVAAVLQRQRRLRPALAG
jgi:Zn-dependent protease/CBS domain-containing protein